MLRFIFHIAISGLIVVVVNIVGFAAIGKQSNVSSAGWGHESSDRKQWPFRVPIDWPSKPDRVMMRSNLVVSEFVADHKSDEKRFVVDCTVSGWPWKSWWVATVYCENRTTYDVTVVDSGGSDLSSLLGLQAKWSMNRLPVGVRPMQLGANTIVIAIPIHLLYCAYRRLVRRMRLKRGECLGCGYPKLGNEKANCPECGLSPHAIDR